MLPAIKAPKGNNWRTGNGVKSWQRFSFALLLQLVIDFGEMSILDAQHYADVFEHVKRNVLPDVQQKADEEMAREILRSQSQIQRDYGKNTDIQDF